MTERLDTIVVGAALLSGTVPISKTNVPGYIRGFDVRTGKRNWTFHTVPRAGEPGVETWENDSWKYTGNTGAWAPLAGDEELGYVYIPVEAPTRRIDWILVRGLEPLRAEVLTTKASDHLPVVATVRLK